MSVIKRTVNTTSTLTLANSFVDILNELAVPKYFSSIKCDEATATTSSAIVNFYIEDGDSEKLAMTVTFKTGTTATAILIYGATENLTVSMNDNTQYGRYQYVFATENGLLFSADTSGAAGSSVIITKDIEGDTVFAAPHVWSSSIRSLNANISSNPAYTAVKLGKANMLGQNTGVHRSSSYQAPLTTLVPLVLSDGSGSYCDKAFLVVNSQFFGTGEIDVANDHFLFTNNFAILDS